MSLKAPLAVVQGTTVKVLPWLKAVFIAVEAAFNNISRFLEQATGIIICLGGLCAAAGWLLSAIHPDPVGPTWNAGIWLVVIGALLLVLGILALLSQHLLRIGMIGQYGIIIFLVGAIIVVAGVLAIDLYILPWMARLFADFPHLGSVLQSGYTGVQNGVNTATNQTASAGSSVCNTIANPFGGNNPCSTNTSTTVVPNQQVPSLGPDELLAKIGLPSASTLGTLGLIFLSGAPLAPGCILMGAVFLMAGVRPRSALFLVMLAAVLNLLGQFAFRDCSRIFQ